MESMSSTADRTRQERVLAAALEVFGRYGFRKTSMDEVARSAGISRQGLYLYFASKEALFRAAVRQELDTALGDASRCLDKEGAALDQRVVAALDAWLGRYVGSTLASDIAGLLLDPAVQFGDMVDAASAAFDARLAATIAAATAEEDRTRLGVTPGDITAALHTVGQGAKYLSTSRRESRAEFGGRLTVAVRVVLAGLDATAKKAP
jgi:TetR/AcrR family transcriptional regulator of autoinduction and epiphytic fitness